MKSVEEYGPTVNNNVRKRCLICEYPNCKHCKIKYVGQRAIKTGTAAFVGLDWYCGKPECRKAAAAAKQKK